MAEVASLAPFVTKQKNIASKLVQEIAKKGDQIPEEYLHKNGFPQAIDAPNLWTDDLLIDFSLLSSSSTSELAKLRSALSQWGCFQVINHGMENSFLEELIEVSKQFFALPLEEKLKCIPTDETLALEGYGSDASDSGTRALNWNDRLNLRVFPHDKVDLQYWPQKPEKFKGLIDEYSKNMSRFNKEIFKAMARSLNLDDESCSKFGKQGLTIARFTLYPRSSCPESVLGTREHTDGATITYILPQKEVGGLHVLKDDQWYTVSNVPGALFVNLGDLGEVMSNGVFKSVVHRVGTNVVKERVSVVMFFLPNDEDTIEPISELVSIDRPQLYKKFKLSDYWPKFHESFQHQGLRTLDAFKI